MKVRSMINGVTNNILRETTGMYISVYPSTEVITVERGSKKSIVIDTNTGASAYSELGLISNPKYQVIKGRSVVQADMGNKVSTIALASLAGVVEHIIRTGMKEWDCMSGLHVNHMDGCGSEEVVPVRNDRLYNLELVTATQDEVHIVMLNKLNGLFNGQRQFAISAEDVETLSFIKYHTPLEIMCWLKNQYIEKDSRGYEYINLAGQKLARWKAIWQAEEQKQLSKKVTLQQERG